MKKIIFILSLSICFLTSRAYSQCQWENLASVGVIGSPTLSYTITEYQGVTYIGGYQRFGTIENDEFVANSDFDMFNGFIDFVEVLSDGNLYVAGVFKINGLDAAIARFNGNNWETLPDIIIAGETFNPKDIVFYNGDLIVTVPDADFILNPDPHVGLYKLNSVTDSWELFAGGFIDEIQGGGICKMLVFQDSLYIAGAIKYVGLDNLPVNNFAKWNGTIWQNLGGTNFSNNTYVENIFEANGKLYLTGLMNFCTGCNNKFVQYDNGNFDDLGYTGDRVLDVLFFEQLYTFGFEIHSLIDGVWQMISSSSELSGEYVTDAHNHNFDEIWLSGVCCIQSRPDLGSSFKKLIQCPITPLGVNTNNSVSDDLVLFPNPVNGDIINIKNTSINIVFQAFDVTGRKVLDGQSVNNQLNISDLSSGMYIFKLINPENKNTISSHKIIIN